MNGIEKITARIETDVKAEIEEIRKNAEARAAEIRADYEAKAKAAAEKAEAAGREAAARQKERLESAAKMDAKKELLAAKQACLDEAFEQARKKLLALPEDEYVELLARLAVQASTTGREELIFSQRDRERVGAKVVSRANAMLAEASAPEMKEEMKESKIGGFIAKVVTGAHAFFNGTAQLTLSEETREMEGGLTLRDGNVEVNCAFETQLRVLRSDMAAEIAAILFV